MRNHSLDTLKFICAVLVVMLHVKTPWQHYYLPVTRCAVPVFFIISGYFLMGEGMISRMWKGSRRILVILVYSSILFAFVSYARHGFNFGSIIPSVSKIVKFLLLNDNPWAFHLWYLSAYLYVLLLCIVIDKYKLWTIAFSAVPFLLVTDLVFGKYSLLILNREYPYVLVRNFLFVGLPYFLIGAYIKKLGKQTCKKVEMLLGGVFLFSFTSIVENRLLIVIGLNPERDHYLSTTFLAVSLFLLFLNRMQEKPTTISIMGARDSLYIYIFHPIWIYFFYMVVGMMAESKIADFLSIVSPVIILGCTIILIMLLRNVKLIR